MGSLSGEQSSGICSHGLCSHSLCSSQEDVHMSTTFHFLFSW